MSRFIKDFWGKLLSPLYVGEKEFITKLSNHLRLSSEAFKVLEDMVLSTTNNDTGKVRISEGMREIAALEREGDEIVRSINNEILRGAVPITTASVMDAIANKADDILDGVHVLSREIRRAYLLCNTEPVRRFLNEELLEMIKIGENALSKLVDMVDNMDKKDMEDLRITVLGIQKLEEEVDDIKDTALDKLYADAKELTYVEFMSIMSLIFGIDDIIDSIKDIAYMLLTMLTTYTA